MFFTEIGLLLTKMGTQALLCPRRQPPPGWDLSAEEHLGYGTENPVTRRNNLSP